jgi:hypothetical protein
MLLAPALWRVSREATGGTGFAGTSFSFGMFSGAETRPAIESRTSHGTCNVAPRKISIAATTPFWKTQGFPFSFRARHGDSGTRRAIKNITKRLRWRLVRGLLSTGEISRQNFSDEYHELGLSITANLEAGIVWSVLTPALE